MLPWQVCTMLRKSAWKGGTESDGELASAWDGEEGEERMEDLTGLKQQVLVQGEELLHLRQEVEDVKVVARDLLERLQREVHSLLPPPPPKTPPPNSSSNKHPKEEGEWRHVMVQELSNKDAQLSRLQSVLLSLREERGQAVSALAHAHTRIETLEQVTTRQQSELESRRSLDHVEVQWASSLAQCLSQGPEAVMTVIATALAQRLARSHTHNHEEGEDTTRLMLTHSGGA